MLKRDAIIIANARKLIKASKKTTNCQLYMNLFGTGMGTAIKRCIDLGLDPDSNNTFYDSMVDYIEKSAP